MWKSNWEETKRHYTNWWQHKGGVLRILGLQMPEVQHEEAVLPDFKSKKDLYTNAELKAKLNHYRLSRAHYPADNLPIASAEKII